MSLDIVLLHTGRVTWPFIGDATYVQKIVKEIRRRNPQIGGSPSGVLRTSTLRSGEERRARRLRHKCITGTAMPGRGDQHAMDRQANQKKDIR